jgi:hypothetical protein
MPREILEFLKLPIPGQTLTEDREIKVEDIPMQIYSYCWNLIQS